MLCYVLYFQLLNKLYVKEFMGIHVIYTLILAGPTPKSDRRAEVKKIWVMAEQYSL